MREPGGYKVNRDDSLETKAETLYQFIYDFLTDNAKSPSHKEMTEALHISTETLGYCLDELKRQERPIQRVRGRGRQIWVPINQQPEGD